MTKLQNLEMRLPPLDAALALEGLGMEVQREQFGMKWCAAHGVGARRKLAGPTPLFFAPPLAELDRVPETAAIILRDQVRVFLSEMCRKCPHTKCPMKSW